jgi:hypothetical protein
MNGFLVIQTTSSAFPDILQTKNASGPRLIGSEQDKKNCLKKLRTMSEVTMSDCRRPCLGIRSGYVLEMFGSCLKMVLV